MKRYSLQLPKTDTHNLSQDQAFFYLLGDDGKQKKIDFHDYGQIYQSPGLYEQIFYDRLRCTSPQVVTDILHKAVASEQKNFTELRVLDFGAGNGLMGDALGEYGISRLVGADIEPEAKVAAYRDRPGLYDGYYVEDFTELSSKSAEELEGWSFNCLTTVAALGFGDIPVKAFMQAMNLVDKQGWIAFNIKETFLKPSDNSGFSSFIRSLMLSDYLDIHFIERYRHRVSIEGVPLFYYAVVAKKTQHIPENMIKGI